MAEQPPGRSPGDIAHSVVRAGLSAIPFVGGSASELLALVIAPPLEKRRGEWMESVAEALNELEGKIEGFSVEALRDNEVFITTLLHASQMALRSHQQEKLEALRNAVMNSALAISIDEDLIAIFLNHVDTLTPWHLRVLTFFENPQQWMDGRGIIYPSSWAASPKSVLEHASPELKDKRYLYNLIIQDLDSKGLITTDNFDTIMSTEQKFAPRTTVLGKRFMAFIRYPLETKE